jgi:hypothetical protein
VSGPDQESQRARQGLERRPTYRRRHRIAAVWRLFALAACTAAAVAIRGAGIEPEAKPHAEAEPLPAKLTPITSDPDARRSFAGGRTVRPPVPRAADVEDAREFAEKRSGYVAFAVIDTRGKMHGFRHRSRFAAASIVKAPLLVARLRDLRRSGERLAPAERDRLASMIRWSDNDAADVAYSAIGDPALVDTVKEAGMRRFTVAGHWGNAQITAADAARFMSSLRRVLPDRHRKWAKKLLATVVPEQRWGIPEVAAPWRIWLKGGWTDTRRGELVSQAALLKHRDRRMSIAILTDAQPSQEYGRETLLGVAARMLKSGAEGKGR